MTSLFWIMTSLFSLPLRILDEAQELYKSYVAPRVSPTTISLLVIVVAVTNVYLQSNKSPTPNTNGSTNNETSKTKTKTKDIFDTFHRNKAGAKGGAGKKSHGDEKPSVPFGSYYYYAHNDPSRTGGYKDGLAMEDYVMNKPKLLSKGGKKVEEVARNDTHSNDNETQIEELDTNDDKTGTSSSSTAIQLQRPPALPSNSVPISRYMWDDTAVTSGCSDVGKLYIDSLPNKPSTRPDIAWSGAGIVKGDVSAQILGDDGSGLLITIARANKATGTEPKYYHLFIRKMYGQVDEAKVVVKAKRLLVKLVKKKNRLNLWDKKNLKSWPQLSEKASGGSDDVGYIDESLFKRDVSQAGPAGIAAASFDEELFGDASTRTTNMGDLD